MLYNDLPTPNISFYQLQMPMKIADRYLQLKQDIKYNEIVRKTKLSVSEVKTCLAGRHVNKRIVRLVEKGIDEAVGAFADNND